MQIADLASTVDELKFKSCGFYLILSAEAGRHQHTEVCPDLLNGPGGIHLRTLGQTTRVSRVLSWLPCEYLHLLRYL